MKLTHKTKATFIIALGIICVGSLVSSCKKLIEIDPPNNTITTTVVFNTDAQAYSALAGIYSQMMSNTGLMVYSNGAASLFGGLSADELASNSGSAIPATYQFETNTLNSSNTNVSTYFWTPAYKMIDAANTIIEGVGASNSSLLTDSARIQLVGESKFLRAFNYFYLTNFFGNVPLVLTTDFNKTVALPGAAQADIYKQINQDLLDAQSTLKTNYSISGNERIRANKWAATALLARAYLYEKDWPDAETQASAVIGNSQYALVSNLSAVFNKNSTEAIFQLQQNASVSPYVGTYEARNFIPAFNVVLFGPTYLQSVALYQSISAFTIPVYYLTPQMASAFEANDQRKTVWTVAIPTPALPPYNGVPYYYPFKYTSNNSSTTAAITQYYMVLRLAEQYLIRAEARAEQNNLTGAVADLNIIRNRAGLPNTTAVTQGDILTAIMHERQVELFSEWGHRFFDLKRTGQANTVLGAIASKQPWNTNQLLYPIPVSETTNDAFLQQNPGY